MLRLFGLLALSASIVYLTHHLSAAPGQLSLEWFGYRIDTTALAFMIALAGGLFLLWIAFKLVTTMLFFPAIWSKKRRSKQLDQALHHVIEAQSALTLGHHEKALKESAQANRFLRSLPLYQPIAKLIHAQAMQQQGDVPALKHEWRGLLNDPRTELAATHSLLQIARNEGDVFGAAHLAEQAYEKHPKEPVVVRTLLTLYKQTNQHQRALTLIDNSQVRHGLRRQSLIVNPERERAILRAAQAHANDNAQSFERLRAAHKQAPKEPNITYLLAQHALTEREKRYAIQAIEQLWKTHPSGALATQFFALTASMTPMQQLKRIQKLVNRNLNHPESQLLLAQAADAVGKPDHAAEHRTNAGDYHAGWYCESCGTQHADWEFVCSGCGQADTITWGATDNSPRLHTTEPVASLQDAA